MKKIIIITFFTIFISNYAIAFDFHGIKSGMTKEQVMKAMSKLGAKKAGYPDNKWEGFKSITFSPHTALTEYDYAGKLLELQLGYSTYKFSRSKMAAIKSVLKSKYKAIILELDNGLGAILTDEKILRSDIQYYKNKYKKEM